MAGCSTPEGGSESGFDRSQARAGPDERSRTLTALAEPRSVAGGREGGGGGSNGGVGQPPEDSETKEVLADRQPDSEGQEKGDRDFAVTEQALAGPGAATPSRSLGPN